MTRLDRTEQRIVGVLIEKQLSLPDSYPLSENALVDGCNQKSNRDPFLELATFQVSGALMALQEKGWVARVEGGGRVPKFRHRTAELLHVDDRQLAVLAELLLRGPQAPGALKPRVARLGCHATPEEIEAMLRRFAEQKPPLAEQLPLAPRERDRRWRHLLGDGSERQEPTSGGGAAVPAPRAARTEPAPAPDLEARIARLEAAVEELRQQLLEQRPPPRGD